MIVEALLLSMALGLLRKGKLVNFAYVNVKWIYLFMLGALVQAILFNIANENDPNLGLWLYDNFYVLHIISYLFILLPLVINVRWQGFQYMAIGTLLNLIAIAANGGKMPVKLPVGYDSVFDMGHTLWTGATKFKFFSDFIFLGPPYPLQKVLSIGDLFLIIGVFWFIQHVMTNEELMEQTPQE